APGRKTTDLGPNPISSAFPLFGVRKRDVFADREADENILFTGEMLSYDFQIGCSRPFCGWRRFHRHSGDASGPAEQEEKNEDEQGSRGWIWGAEAAHTRGACHRSPRRSATSWTQATSPHGHTSCKALAMSAKPGKVWPRACKKTRL